MSSLQNKKARDGENMFVIEGEKTVREFLEAGMHLRVLAATAEFISTLPAHALKQVERVETAGPAELKQMSSLTTPNSAIAALDRFCNAAPGLPQNLTVALDCIQNPGNLGTIIRAAAWFGIGSVVCSRDCVDVYNPKVIQASMGALLHVTVGYVELVEYIKNATANSFPVYGTMLAGNSIYSQPLGASGIILLGNESKGISVKLAPFITHKILIPGVHSELPGIDSLNAGMAASIIFSEFYRRSL
jgi:TrmH family RNA methyltransferase